MKNCSSVCRTGAIFRLTGSYILLIIYLTREPMTSVHLAAGKNITTKSSALSYQDEGATFCVVCR